MVTLLYTLIEVTIFWGPPPPDTPIVRGYNVYQDGVQAATVTERRFVQNVDFTNPHCWRVAAFNYAGESPLSDELCLGKPQAPQGLNATFPE